MAAGPTGRGEDGEAAGFLGLPTSGLSWVSVTGLVAASMTFVITRAIVLDVDVPPWTLSQYSPVDEFSYVAPSFYLNQYGTWTHAAAAWAPVEGWPMNVLQSLAAALTLALGGSTYAGLRSSSIAFGLVGFLTLLAVVRHQVNEALASGSTARWLARAILVATALLLLVDFSYLSASRIVEPTIARLAALAVMLWLVARGTFFGTRHGPWQTAVFGMATGAIVWFVYVYNAFMLVGGLGLVAAWAAADTRNRSPVRHLAAYLGGVLAVSVIYFAFVKLVYDQDPAEWYRVWIAFYNDSTRVAGVSLANAMSLLRANVFSLDKALLILTLASLPVFVRYVLVARRPWATYTLILLGAFVAQSAFVADYPARKFLVLLPFALPIAASGPLALNDVSRWVGGARIRGVFVTLWLLVVSVIVVRLGTPGVGRDIRILVVSCGLLAGLLIVLVVLSRSLRAAQLGAVIFVVTIVAPLAAVDFVTTYRAPETTYRDALIAAAPEVNGRTTAGGLSFGMQLYNTSRAVLNGYAYGQTRMEYETNVIRLFKEGGAASMFTYTDPATLRHWESLGFRLVERLTMRLPHGQQLGRYVFRPG